MTYGLTSAGYIAKSLDVYRQEIEAAELASISSKLNLVAPDPIAVVNGIMAERLALLDAFALALYAGQSPTGASGDQLTGVLLLTGTDRRPQTETIVACTIGVDAAFSASAGTMFASVSGDPTILFANVGAFSAGGAGTTTGVVFQCTTTGPHPVNAATLTVIASPLAHWTSITNPSAGITGQDTESDAAARIRQQAELAAGGSTSSAAIASDILRLLAPANSPLTIDGIAMGTTLNPFTLTATTVSVRVLRNDTDATDANGLPPHSIEAIAYAPGNSTADDYALAALLLSDKAGGIATYSGNGTSKNITDTDGTTEAVYYTRPTPLPTLIAVTVRQRSGFVVSEAEVQDAIMAYVAGTNAAGTALAGQFAHWIPGGTAYASSIIGAVFAFDIAGVADVTAITLSAANSGANIVPTIRQIVTVTTPSADIVVTII